MSNYDPSVLQNPSFNAFSCLDPKVEKMSKKISKVVGQEGDITSWEVKKLESSFCLVTEPATARGLSSSLWKWSRKMRPLLKFLLTPKAIISGWKKNVDTVMLSKKIEIALTITGEFNSPCRKVRTRWKYSTFVRLLHIYFILLLGCYMFILFLFLTVFF